MVQLDMEVITLLPSYILDNHGNVVLGMDIMKMDNIPFLTIIRIVVKFGNASEITNVAMGNRQCVGCINDSAKQI